MLEQVLGGLLNASFGNAVELIVSIIALVQGKVLIVQTSLIGSMLSNLLLVMGMCFFFGGIGRQQQYFNVTVAQTAASLLALAIGGLIIPTAFQIFGGKGDKGVAQTSRGTAVMLLVTYGCYLFFQLKTHRAVYNEPSAKSPKKSRKKSISQGIANAGTVGAQVGSAGDQNVQSEEPDDEEDPPLLTRIGALVTLAGSTVLVALCAEYMVSAIDALSKDISEEFIGLILLPIVGNAAEHATAVTVRNPPFTLCGYVITDVSQVAIKDKMDLAIGVAIGSSLQIALLVLPLMVLFSWWGVGAGTGETLTLAFDGFQVSVLFIGIVLVNYLIQDGESHWLEGETPLENRLMMLGRQFADRHAGVLLEVIYFIIAIAAWFYPAPGDLAG
jgi:Ca2+:H+ antiporter